MPKPTDSTSESLMFTTVRIETRQANGSVGVGTAFLFQVPAHVDDRVIPLLVTNKHVLRGSDSFTVWFHEAAGEAGTPDYRPTDRHFPTTVSLKTCRWFDHPAEDVDLCACLAHPLFTLARETHGAPAYYQTLDTSFTLDQKQLEQLMTIEDVVMVGYPTGLWDDHNNMPIVRRGSTATHPAIDYRGRAEAVVDIAAFPGSSGSPVYLYNAGAYAVKGKGTHSGTRVFLLGVLYAGPILNNEGEIQVRDIPTVKTPVAVIQSMIHLGYYIKAREVLALGEHIRRSLGLKIRNDV